MTSTNRVRERLLQTATTLFADRGYEGTSVRAICARAGTNLGAVSYHFGGKRQLYRAVLRRAVEEAASELPQLASPAPGATPPSADKLALRILTLLERHPETVRLVLRDLADGGEIALEATAPLLRRGFERFSAEETGGAHGEIPARLAYAAAIAPAAGSLLIWPVLRVALGLTEEDRARLLSRALSG